MNTNLTVINGESEAPLTHAGLIEKYLSEFPNLGRQTRHNYQNYITQYIKWLGARPINAETMDLYAREYEHSYRKPSSVQQFVRHAMKFGRWMWKRKYLAENPSEDVKVPRVPKQPIKQGYTPDEYVKIVEFMRLKERNHDYMSFVIIAYHTGMSAVDVCLLKWGEVDLNKGVIRRVREKMKTSSRSEQIIPIEEGGELEGELMRLALKYKHAPEEPVNPALAYAYNAVGNTGLPGKILRHEVTRLIEASGVRSRGTHGFRRQLLTALANAEGISSIQASWISGHSNVNQLKEYATVNTDKLRQVALPILRDHFAQSRRETSELASALRESLHPDASKRPTIVAKVTEVGP